MKKDKSTNFHRVAFLLGRKAGYAHSEESNPYRSDSQPYAKAWERGYLVGCLEATEDKLSLVVMPNL